MRLSQVITEKLENGWKPIAMEILTILALVSSFAVAGLALMGVLD